MKRLLLVLAVLCLASSARGQHWTEIPLPTDWSSRSGSSVSNKPITPYFLNGDLGFIFCPSYDVINSDEWSHPQLHRTTDGGKTWNAITSFDSTASHPTWRPIGQLYFANPSHGYAAIVNNLAIPNTPGGIYETVDTGNTWRKVSPFQVSFRSVYAAGSFIAGTADVGPDEDGSSKGPLYFSNDGGVTWDSMTQISGHSTAFLLRFSNVCGDGDSLVAAVAIDTVVDTWLLSPDIVDSTRGGYLVYSTDRGRHWESRLLHNAWNFRHWFEPGLYIPPSSCSVFPLVASLGDQEDENDFLRGNLQSNSWTTSIHGWEMGQFMDGKRCALYVPSAIYPPIRSHIVSNHGVLRSTDMGDSWT